MLNWTDKPTENGDNLFVTIMECNCCINESTTCEVWDEPANNHPEFLAKIASGVEPRWSRLGGKYIYWHDKKPNDILHGYWAKINLPIVGR